MATGHIKPGVDLLHPLATLHWEHCHTWRDAGLPIHCAVLEDKVAILTWSSGSCDMLHISSTDLQSWTIIPLPYQLMSLTTYHSKFVAVGGSHPSTNEFTDQLFTSDTGLKWEVSLPPMPTKRFSTSSVSTRSPEALVVAGGLSGSTKLDIVEVLQGNHWHTVAPLPTACMRLHSVLHGENLCFIGGVRQDYKVYTCSCSSLISSCEESSNTMTTDRLLWSQFKTTFGTAVSYSSYLVSIDHKGTIRAYSSVTQSWVEATSKRAHGNVITEGTATPLPTGELVYADNYGSVYKGKLSVCSFDPDSRFISNVLSRLEAIMGVQIISVLANDHSQLTTTSGVQLQPLVDEWGYNISLPDPRTAPDQYVVEVISQWSAGYSHRPPTWRNLLEVLQDVGLSKLSQQIDTFMKGDTHYFKAYRHFVDTKDSLELFFLKFLFLGLPRLGKTTVRRRLMGEIMDLISAEEADHPHPSTGTVETGHSVVVRNVSNTAAIVTESEWSAVASLEDEASMLFHNLVDAISRSASTLPEDQMSQDIVHSPSVVSTDDTTSHHDITSLHLDDQVRQEGLPQTTTSYITSSDRVSHELFDVSLMLKETMASPYWKDVKSKFKAHLRMEDTGGQPELMDMLPALTIGPGLYLLFINLQNELDKKYRVSYCRSSGESTPPLESTYTVMEMLFTALSSISCSSTGTLNTFKEEATPELSNILESSQSVAYVIGTHKDKVTNERVRNLNKQLIKHISSTAFFKKNIVQFISEDELIIAVDNMKGGKDEIFQVRALLEKAMEKHFKKLKIPAVWLLFSLVLRKQNIRTAKLEFCLGISRTLNMSEYETKVAIWFLHHHAGVMMYFPDVPGLEDLVIIDVQVVYDSVTILILRAMNYEEVGCYEAIEFKKTGQFLLSHIIAVTSKVSGDVIPPRKLVALLEYLHIIARIPNSSQDLELTSHREEDDVTYFMPCVLENATIKELDSVWKDTSLSLSVAPIMVYFSCGFVPIGVFPAMIACLIGSKSFKFIKDGMKKNVVQFHYGRNYHLITLSSQPQYYTIQISEWNSNDTSVKEECIAIKDDVESTIAKVGSRMNYGSFMDYQFSFECPLHPGRDHLCVVEKEDPCPRVMLCMNNQDRPKPVNLKECHQVWFSEVSSSLNPGTKCTIDDETSLKKIRLLKWKDEHGADQQLRILEEVSSHWKAIGDMLDITIGRLDTIESNHAGNAEECCRRVLKEWLCCKGTKTYPTTWRGLCILLEDIKLLSLGDRIYRIITNPKNLFH